MGALGIAGRVVAGVATLGLSEGVLAVGRAVRRKNQAGEEVTEQETAVPDPIPQILPMPLPLDAAAQKPAPAPAPAPAVPPPADYIEAVKDHNAAAEAAKAAQSELDAIVDDPAAAAELERLRAAVAAKAQAVKAQADAHRVAAEKARAAAEAKRKAVEAQRAEIARLKSFLGEK